MAKVQKVYTKEFKEEAVKLVQSSGKPVAQIARELGVSDLVTSTLLHIWPGLRPSASLVILDYLLCVGPFHASNPASGDR